MTSNAVIVAIVTTLLLPGRVVWGADARDVEDLQIEVRQLRAELQSLRSAIAEAAELELQRSATLSKPETESPGREPSPPQVSAAAGDDRPARPARHRRHRHTSRRR